MISSLRRLAQKLKTWPERQRRNKHASFHADALSVKRRNLGFLSEPDFVRGWTAAVQGNVEGWQGDVPDIRWRAHIALWAARHGLAIEGDFVECGVHTGLLSVTICHALNFERIKKSFYLFDTFGEGIPGESLSGTDAKIASGLNARYSNAHIFDYAKRNFAPFPNAKLVKGVIPQSFSQVNISKIAYLSIDLNNSVAERAAIDALWDKVSVGAFIVLDDYAWFGFEDQYAMWNDFAGSKGQFIATLPTGQGLLIKS
jgi:O-methyltransferase